VLVRHQTYSWRIFHATDSSPITSQLLGPGHRFPFCDIFVMRPHKGRWDLRDKEGRHVWPHENYSIQQVEGREKRVFGDFLLPCPGEPEEYLDRNYGPSWRVQGATQWLSHDSGQLSRPQSFPLHSFHPARPFS